jgi:hypothetical protein
VLDDFLRRTFGLTAEELTHAFELVSKIALTLVGLTYVLGLIIVNLYLRRFGFFSAGLLRVEYVMAGALWLALFGLGYVFEIIARREVAVAKYMWSEGRRKKAIARGVSAWLVPNVAFLFILMHLFDSFSVRSWRDWNAAIVIIATPAIFLKFADFVKAGWQSYRQRPNDPSMKLPVFKVALQGAMLLTFLTYYAQTAYPRIHLSYGGGKPNVIRITATDRVADVLRQNAGTRASQTYDLIADTGDWLVIAPHESEHEWPWPSDSRSAIRVRRDDVISVISVERAGGLKSK